MQFHDTVASILKGVEGKSSFFRATIKYKGVDGFAPIFAYLGAEGYLVNLEFREGKQHCQKNTPGFISDTLDYARKITDQPILMRLDSGNDSKDNFPDESRPNVHFIIKRNLAPRCFMWVSQNQGYRR